MTRSLAEELAAQMWERQRDSEIDPAWEKAGPYWQRVMRQFADTTVKMLRDG